MNADIHPDSMYGLVEATGGVVLTSGGVAFTSYQFAKFVTLVAEYVAAPRVAELERENAALRATKGTP